MFVLNMTFLNILNVPFLNVPAWPQRPQRTPQPSQRTPQPSQRPPRLLQSPQYEQPPDSPQPPRRPAELAFLMFTAGRLVCVVGFAASPADRIPNARP